MSDEVVGTPGGWRITVDSWITGEAGWYGRRVFFIEANSLPEALEKASKLGPQEYLAEDGLELRNGTMAQAHMDDRMQRKVNVMQRERIEGK